MVALERGRLQPPAADALAAALHHRGPDGHGRHADDRAILGVTRLRIVDPHPRADQPFADPSGRVALACNGEIYNAADLRQRYRAYPFRSQSDVETILPLYLDRGPAGLGALEGMFALAIWDARHDRLVLARDRAGEKPLFYGLAEGALWFASEIGALLRAGWSRALDSSALAEFVRLGYVREPRTPFATIRKLPAGTILTAGRHDPTIDPYWQPFGEGTDGADAVATRDTLVAAVRRQLTADVPLGVFTSGGLDSSLLAAIAVDTLGADRVRTFAVGFPERAFDERRDAARLAAHLGTEHFAVEIREDDVPGQLDALAACGEPIGDPAALPTLALAAAARPHVTVVLSGEGGDELFGGYPTYVGHTLATRYAALPSPLRAVTRRLARALPRGAGRLPLAYLLERFAVEADRPWLERHVAWFGTGLPRDAFPDGSCLVPGLAPPEAADRDVVRQAMRFDYMTSLRERLLVKNDRATMRVSLEARAPFLDPTLITQALAAPGHVHVHGLRGKHLLREVARPWLPGFILRKRKRGLTVPTGRWLRGVLAEATGRLVRDGPLARTGLLRAPALERMVREHRTGRADHGRALWPLVALHWWLTYWDLEVRG